MNLLEFAETISAFPNAAELSVVSDGGYGYRVVDDSGNVVSPSALGIVLAAQKEEFIKVEGDVYAHNAVLKCSDNILDQNKVHSVMPNAVKDILVIRADVED